MDVARQTQGEGQPKAERQLGRERVPKFFLLLVATWSCFDLGYSEYQWR